MPSVLAYHRPETLDEASSLLSGPNSRAIGGGTVAVPESRGAKADGVELVDLQGLGLDGIEQSGNRLILGSMIRLGDLVSGGLMSHEPGGTTPGEMVPQLIRDLARRELPSTLRNQATLGGTIALGDSESILLAGLLVHGAQVHLHGQEPISLEQSLAECVGNRVVTAVSIELDDSATGGSATASTGRTPADIPIVAAIGRRVDDVVRMALTGLAPSPVLVDPSDPLRDLDPVGDFRGSPAYRRHLATTLCTRVLGELT